jgi:hypothetical protein
MRILGQHKEFSSCPLRNSIFNMLDLDAVANRQIFIGGILVLLLALVVIALIGCGFAGTPPKPPPPTVVVTIQPATASLFLGQTQTFQVTVTGNANTNVTWEVNGFAGVGSATGTISAAGLFTAPTILPPGSSVTVTAVAQVNPKDDASVTVALQDHIAISVLPTSATVSISAAQLFTATVAPGTGSPSTAVT